MQIERILNFNFKYKKKNQIILSIYMDADKRDLMWHGRCFVSKWATCVL